MIRDKNKIYAEVNDPRTVTKIAAPSLQPSRPITADGAYSIRNSKYDTEDGKAIKNGVLTTNEYGNQYILETSDRDAILVTDELGNLKWIGG
jgi:hypothetical protein